MLHRKALLYVVPALALPAFAAAGERTARVEATSGERVREWSGRVDRLLAAGELAVRLTRDDTMIPGRRHERLAQLHRGVPVFGGELARQSDAASTLTVFGTLYEGIDVEVAPRLSPREAEARLAARGGRPFGSRGGPELIVLPLDDGDYRLAYRVRAFFEESLDVRQSFLDATTGELLLEYSDIRTQAAGIGTGVLGDQKKISVAPGGAGFTTSDRLRPPAIFTYNFNFDFNRWMRFVSADGAPSSLTAADLGTDADNVWTDGALVDAHAYAGYTYDYYFKRFGRHGLDNANVAMHSITHALRWEDRARYPEWTGWILNASYIGDGVMYYGDGLPPGWTLGGQRVNYFAAALDIVAHELTHGVTEYSSGLVYRNEPGALDEALCDIMATGAEFYLQPGKADYLAGEDVFTPGGLRSLQNPMAYGDPDHYSIRYTGASGGVHTTPGSRTTLSISRSRAAGTASGPYWASSAWRLPAPARPSPRRGPPPSGRARRIERLARPRLRRNAASELKIPGADQRGGGPPRSPRSPCRLRLLSWRPGPDPDAGRGARPRPARPERRLLADHEELQRLPDAHGIRRGDHDPHELRGGLRLRPRRRGAGEPLPWARAAGRVHPVQPGRDGPRRGLAPAPALPGPSPQRLVRDLRLRPH
jgi:Zn-dependent metalloprotease